jgi:8-oxo-dGTP pyrophosphatase MutT (NUDIX family)
MPHIHEKIDFTVEVFIVYQDKVLLRFHDKYNIWLSVGGHIELNEDPVEAALREVGEEVGLKISLYSKNTTLSERENYRELIPPIFLNRHRINDTHEHVAMTYFASSDSDVISPGAGESITSYKWLTSQEVSAMDDLLPDVKNYALEALKILPWSQGAA